MSRARPACAPALLRSAFFGDDDRARSTNAGALDERARARRTQAAPLTPQHFGAAALVAVATVLHTKFPPAAPKKNGAPSAQGKSD